MYHVYGMKYIVVLAFITGAIGYWLYQPVPPGYSNPWKYRYFSLFMKASHRVIFIGEYFGYWKHVDAMRALMDRTMTRQPPADDGIKATDAVFDGVKVRIYEPQNKQTKGPGIVYLHGGGWVFGNVDSYDHVVRYMVKKLGVVVVSVDYRLAPEHPFPAPLEDCVTALKYFLKNAKSFDVDPGRVAVAGDSAGGNLAAAVSMKLRGNIDFPKLRAQILVAPMLQCFDFKLPSYQDPQQITFHRGTIWSREFLARYCLHYLGMTHELMPYLLENMHTSPRHKEVYTEYLNYQLLPKEFIFEGYRPSGLQFGDEKLSDTMKQYYLHPHVHPSLAKNLRGLPDAFIATAQYDHLRDEGVIYALRLEKAGVKVKHFHSKTGWHPMMHLVTAETKELWDNLSQYVRENL